MNKRGTFLVLLCLAFTNICSAQKGWVSFRSPDKDFTVMFPTTPEASNDTANLATGLSTIYYYISQPSELELYMVSKLDTKLPAGSDTKTFLETSREATVKSVKGTNIKTIATRFGKEPNIEFTFETTVFRAHSRIYKIGNIQYALMTLTPLEKPESPAVKFFYDSFKLQQ